MIGPHDRRRRRLEVALMALALVAAAFLGALLGFVVDFGPDDATGSASTETPTSG